MQLTVLKDAEAVTEAAFISVARQRTARRA
jgi:hypothetical protein